MTADQDAAANAERVSDAAAFGHVSGDYGRGYADALDDLRIGADRYAEHRRAAAARPANPATAGLILCAAAIFAGWQLGSLLADAIFGAER